MTTFKQNLNNAFAALRKQGIIARQNFSCCQTCALAQLNIDLKAMTAKKKMKTHGYCFYHSQDNDALKAGKDFHLAFGWTGEVTETSPSKHAENNVGTLIQQTLKSHGIDSIWNGTLDARIRVINHIKKGSLMLNKEILDIINQLNLDCPDFYQASPSLREQIAYWINEDRLPQNRIKRKKKREKI